MALEREDVEWVARLAALAITDEEAEAFLGDMNVLVDSFERLQAVDVHGVAPTCHATSGVAPLRADEARPSLTPEEALANAPAREGTSLLVPRILE